MGQKTAKSDKLARTFRHVAKVTLAAIGDFNRDRPSFVVHMARAMAGEMVRSAMRQLDRPTSAVVTSLYSRANAAYNAEFAKWEALIDGMRADRGLSEDQRAAGIVALRIRQRIEAHAVRKRIILEERQAAKFRRQHRQITYR